MRKFIGLAIIPLGVLSYLIPRLESIKLPIANFIGMEKLANLHFLVAVLSLWNIIALVYLYLNIRKGFNEPINRLYNAALAFSFIACLLTPFTELFLFNGFYESLSLNSILFQCSKFLALIFLSIAFRKGQAYLPNTSSKFVPILFIWIFISLLAVGTYLVTLEW